MVQAQQHGRQAQQQCVLVVGRVVEGREGRERRERGVRKAERCLFSLSTPSSFTSGVPPGVLVFLPVCLSVHCLLCLPQCQLPS